MKKKTVLVADYERKIIWIDGEIDRKLADKFLKILKNFRRRKIDGITFYIRGIGGDSSPTFCMVRAMKGSGLRIGCVAYEYVNSACLSLTQAGMWTAALPKTIFGFHRCVLNPKSFKQSGFNKMDLDEMAAMSEFIDQIQLRLFLSRGREIEEIFHLFYNEANISVARAIRIGLVDRYFDKREFLRDKRRIQQIRKKKTRRL